MKKLLSTTIAVGIFASLNIAPALADVSAGALPSLNSATNADVTTAGTNMNIQIQGGQGSVGTLNWNNFNVGKDATVNYEFSAHNQTALNKVSATGGISQIYGKITSSGCAGCGYDGTGKVILINPNGVMFGEGASVNLNSFTASTLDGTYNKDTNQLVLNKDSNQGDYGIVVKNGANIYGDKNVTFASNNIVVYNGSKIATNVGNNVGDTAYGKVKLVTADGVNFTYYNNGAVKEISGIKGSADKMTLNVNGDIKSGNIDIRNYSTNDASEINLKGATLKATKAAKGNDGNIWLTAANRIVTEGSSFQTVNQAGAEAKDGGNIKFTAGKKVSVGSSNLNAVGNIDITSQEQNVVVDASNLTAAKDINITAKNIASVQNKSVLTAKNINVKANKDVYVTNSKLTADKITLDAGQTVAGNADVNNSQTNIYAGKDVNVTLANVGNRNNGLIAKAGNNMTITTDGTLSVSSLISGNDMTINADKVIAGYPLTNNKLEVAGDSADRSYIEVGGTFTSNTKNDSFVVTKSTDLTEDGKFQKRHHIQYGNGTEKILLVNKRPYVAPQPPVDPDPETIDLNDDQAKMLNKIPRQPESFNNKTTINNGRTELVDVFAAASQIEIEDDEEE